MKETREKNPNLDGEGVYEPQLVGDDEDVPVPTIYEEVTGSISSGNIIETEGDTDEGNREKNPNPNPPQTLRRNNKTPSLVSRENLKPEWSGELSPMEYVIAMARLGDPHCLKSLRNLGKRRLDPATARLLMRSLQS